MAKYNIPFEVAIEYDSADLAKMKFQDLQRTAAALSRESRSRIKELNKMESEYGKSPALASYERWRADSGQYSARYKGREALYEEIREMKNFLDNATSTKQGYLDWINDFNESWNIEESSKEFRDEYFRVFRQLQEFFRNSQVGYQSEQVAETMREEVAKSGKRGEELTPEFIRNIGNTIMNKYTEVI